MSDPALQFAVVREDPAVEVDALAGSTRPSVLLVASGGCTAFSIAGRWPDAELTLVDPNPAQHAHVGAKAEAWANGELRRLNVGDDHPEGLSEAGNFERLFRSWRAFVHAWVAPAARVEAAFLGDPAAQAELLGSKWWPVGFELFFSDPMLVTLFGPAAVQHAPRGSYPAYFRAAFERLLRAAPSPFAAHVLLGRYLAEAPPDYLRRPPVPVRARRLVGTLEQVEDFGAYDLVHLSNVLDWTPRAEGAALLDRVGRELRGGATLTVRQLNNEAPVVAPGVRFTEVDGERSCFYRRTLVGRKA